MRSGIKTSEFWIALAVTVMGAVAAAYSENQLAQIAGMVAAALASAGYGFSRANTKAAEALTRPEPEEKDQA